ncbi:hypothetical protein SopranoGao_16 [Klebsiella phage SopranoGao]|uniref:Uncharacterized protein n=1 Tax=Klebsiella phage SopranoGao TaxID=2026944 RepID=A0A248SL22_9CAUD|nr:hypothetical protein KMC54_gp16 [Klebsiella phage SopranoGao]ASV45039.1 hypothetical protein SopranoGao_16 [Klebsiella phage SopranoGao]
MGMNMKTWLIGWSLRKFSTVLIIFVWGKLFRMLFGESDWIAMLVAAFLLAITFRKE